MQQSAAPQPASHSFSVPLFSPGCGGLSAAIWSERETERFLETSHYRSYITALTEAILLCFPSNQERDREGEGKTKHLWPSTIPESGLCLMYSWTIIVVSQQSFLSYSVAGSRHLNLFYESSYVRVFLLATYTKLFPNYKSHFFHPSGGFATCTQM